MSSFKIHNDRKGNYHVITITKNGIVLLSSEKSLKKAEERLQYHRQRDSHGYPLIKDDSAKNFKLDKYGVKMIKLKEVV